MRTFYALLANTAFANIASNFVWFAITFWVYLETRSVLAMGIIGGAYMAALAIFGVPFGTLVDRFRKKPLLVAAAVASVLALSLAIALMLMTTDSALLSLTGPFFWLFIVLILGACIVESIRAIALSTCVTLLVPDDRHANANGLVGAANGIAFLVCSVLSGLAVGFLGIQTTLLIGLAAMAVSLAHLTTIRIPEKEIVHAEGVPAKVDFRAGWAVIVAVPGLLALLVFSTYNNFLGGAFMALLDPYGLELMSVESWGFAYAVCSVGFIVGGALISKFGLGKDPVRTMMLTLIVMWAVCIVFTVRESVVLLVAGMFVYMCLIPAIEAAEQTVLQRVVPYEKQGRVFGFAQAMELAAAPISSFLIAPVAEFWLLPYMRDGGGEAQWAGLLGEGDGRGIALIFLFVGVIGIVTTVIALVSPIRRTLSRSYAAAAPPPTDEETAADRVMHAG